MGVLIQYGWPAIWVATLGTLGYLGLVKELDIQDQPPLLRSATLLARKNRRLVGWAPKFFFWGRRH